MVIPFMGKKFNGPIIVKNTKLICAENLTGLGPVLNISNKRVLIRQNFFPQEKTDQLVAISVSGGKAIR